MSQALAGAEAGQPEGLADGGGLRFSGCPTTPEPILESRALSGGCMADGLKKMGEKFRAKREEMNLTLKEIENVTSIRMVFLQAIEEGRIDHMLSNVYSLGFIRQYASFLGFENESLTKEFPEAFRLPVEKQDFAYGIGTLEMRGSPHGGIRWLPNALWGIGIVFVAIIAWYFAKFVGIF